MSDNNHEEKDQTEQEMRIRIPSTLTFRDVVMVVGVVVSVMLAWGVISTRISLLENAVSDYKQVKQELESVKEKQHELELKLTELQGTVKGLKQK